jgi:hypothetical protein
LASGRSPKRSGGSDPEDARAIDVSARRGQHLTEAAAAAADIAGEGDAKLRHRQRDHAKDNDQNQQRGERRGEAPPNGASMVRGRYQREGGADQRGRV